MLPFRRATLLLALTLAFAQVSAFEAPQSDPRWTNTNGAALPVAEHAIRLLEDAASHGLVPEDYDPVHLRALVQRSASDRSASAQLDLALTSAMLRFLGDLNAGRVEAAPARFKLAPRSERADLAAILKAAVAGDRLPDAVLELAPPFFQYERLRRALKVYRTLAGDPALSEPLELTGTLRPGDASPVTIPLRRRLAAFRDLSEDAAASSDLTYGHELVAAVQRFQIRHGLEPDGVIGAGTRAALEVPMTRRVRQIELALERLRWLPPIDDGPMIVVNIPMFRLWAWDEHREDDVPALTMRVVVGRAARTETPVLLGGMRNVIFRPFWNVPASIARGEILPKLERNPDVLVRDRYEIVGSAGVVPASSETIDAVRRGTLRIRQRPGLGNALGLIKFDLLSEHGIYLHGTPATELFARARRDFSHGCIRVEDPAALAEWALADPAAWSREEILETEFGPDARVVELPRPVTVLVFYATAVVAPENGAIHFTADVYGHDAKLERALSERRAAIR
jgi:murein L,D-transpeptidase YcbB/YkuD